MQQEIFHKDKISKYFLFRILNVFLFQIQESTSSETEILLHRVDLNTTGQFRCEISGEAPLFQTAYSEAVMAVVGESLFFYLINWRNMREILIYSYFLT